MCAEVLKIMEIYIMYLDCMLPMLSYFSLQGSLFVYEPGDNAGVKPLADVHYGNFVGVDMLSPGNDYCVVSLSNFLHFFFSQCLFLLSCVLLSTIY